MDKFTDYYVVLGVEANAPASAIKAAFKKLALQYHPDVYKGSDAQERMRLLLLAYQTLNDPAERKAYDVRRSEHVLGVPAPRVSSQASPDRERNKSSDITPAARRDRQRHYDFPDLSAEHPIRVDLVDITYDLATAEAHTLKQQGMLRGIAPEVIGTMRNESGAYICHRCHHRWTPTSTSGLIQTAERLCPACNASDWAEYLLLHCVHCRAVFESEQIRDEVGSYNYGDGALCPPYELFPLCPYCGASGWCPAEDARVHDLRVQAMHRAAILRLVWLSLVIVAVMVVGAVLVNVVK